ncbi:hypothetical protein Y1Q_0008817 [Alligator mississippiensis]|uniref:Uncharacterized protein n=1 Tax=Alligator mississippiensis TaxID=8496 RepID=A0A151NA78_ALLMI|nr:hypothetical protein Y1Q_0008817 [Alligator mississippiensis]
MTREDDPEAFLKSFERATMVSGLDPSKWATKLGVLLVAQAQVAYSNMSRLDAHNYGKVKEEILYCLDITQESSCTPVALTSSAKLPYETGSESEGNNCTLQEKL